MNDDTAPATTDDAAPESPVAEPEVERAAPAEAAEASRNFGPESDGGRTADVEAEAKGDRVEVTVGEFAGSVISVGVVKDDDETPVREWSATAGEVGVATITASGGVGTGLVTLRLHIQD